MFRALLPRQTGRAITLRNPRGFRFFSSSPLSLKRNSKAKEPVAEPAVGTPELDFKAESARLQKVVEDFARHANEAKLGKTNPHIFDALPVQIADGDAPFNTLAQTSIKGRNLVITVFDPANTKHVINAILGSELNMNPIADPSNRQQLKVPLPPVTTESKAENVKHLKAVYEKYRNGPGSGRHANTLAAVRADVKLKVAKKKKMTPSEALVWTEYEATHKKYVESLTEVFKAAEVAIMK